MLSNQIHIQRPGLILSISLFRPYYVYAKTRAACSQYPLRSLLRPSLRLWGKLDSIHQVSLIVRPSPHIAFLPSLVTVSVLLLLLFSHHQRPRPSSFSLYNLLLIPCSDSMLWSLGQHPISKFLIASGSPTAEKRNPSSSPPQNPHVMEQGFNVVGASTAV